MRRLAMPPRRSPRRAARPHEAVSTTGPASLLPLIWLASPALPVGGFSYSEGLEAAVDAARVFDETSAAAWLLDQLHLSLARADLPVLARALPAWRRADWARLGELDDWVRQTRESAEMRLQTEQMGRSLVEWLKTVQPEALHALQIPAALWSPCYPVAFGLALALHTPATTSVRDSLLAFAFGWAENMVQAALKAVPLGQAAGQRVLARLMANIPAVVDSAQALRDSQRQSFCPMLAILSAQHETQYSRLFRS
ncbi:urease accessory protein UreF [Hydrogenophaga sp. OTU3427]|uniref:urease accessory protein UreF n=1 Tax=Hydrogenophaga sp. OTU3427 TaxID=3043856 RepID=UPI00313DA6A6